MKNIKQSIGVFGFLMLIAETGIAQIRIEGKVFDKATSLPVTFASLGVTKTNRGTITNENGSFVLYADSFPINVSIHSVGYESKIVVVEKRADKLLAIELVPIIYQSKDVVVKANQADALFDKAFNKLKRQESFVYKSKSFFRLLTRYDSSYTELIESFYDTWIGKSGILNWDMQHGRYATVESSHEKRYLSSLDFSLVSRYLNILNSRQVDYINFIPFVFDVRYNKKLLFTITDYLEFDGRELVRVDFEPAKKFKDKIHTKGYIYIDVHTFDIYRIVQDFNKWENPIIEVIDPNLQLKDLNVTFDIRFQKTNLDDMLIQFIKVSYKYSINDKNYDLLHHVNTVADLVCYDYEKERFNARNTIDSSGYETDYNAITHKLYIKEFWDNNSVLAETPIEQHVRMDFEKKGSFSKNFQNSNDTLIILGKNYMTWTGKTIDFTQLGNSKSNNYPFGKQLLSYQGELFGELYGKLYFSWNCFRDTFYFFTIPLLDLRETWIEEGEIGNSSTEFIYSCYLDLLEIHKRKFIKQIKQLAYPCASKSKIRSIFQQAQLSFYAESKLMLNDCWAGDEYARMKGCYKWGKYIHDSLNEK